MSRFDQEYYRTRLEALDFDFNTATILEYTEAELRYADHVTSWPNGYDGATPADEYLDKHRENLSDAGLEGTSKILEMFRDFEQACLRFTDTDHADILSRAASMHDLEKASSWVDSYANELEHFKLVRVGFEASIAVRGLINILGNPLSAAQQIESARDHITDRATRRATYFVYRGMLFNNCIDRKSVV